MDSETPPEVPPSQPPLGTTSRGGRPPKHSHKLRRQLLTQLTTRRLDGRSAVAVAVRQFKADVTADLGGDLSRAQATILEDAAQAWIIRQSLDDYIARQPSLVTKKRTLLPIVGERLKVAEHLARRLDRLGLERTAKPIESLEDYLRRKAAAQANADGALSTT